MSTLEMVMWYLLALLGVSGSAIVSGVETGIYTLNRIRLHVLAHAPGSSAAVLEKLIAKPHRVIVTLLVGNNLFDYFTSLAIGSLLDDAGYKQWAQVGINAVILTPLVLIIGQIVPKDMFRSHSDLTYYFARPLGWLQTLLMLLGIVPLVSGITRMLRRMTGQPNEPEAITHPRRVITQLMREGLGHGVISEYQSSMIDRTLELGHTTVGDVMRPWKQVSAVKASQEAEAVWIIADRVPYSRLPLLDASGRPVGLIEVAEVLRHDPKNCPPLAEFTRPLVELPPALSLRQALQTLQSGGGSMGVVSDRGKPLGLVTLKDLIEPIIGELEVW